MRKHILRVHALPATAAATIMLHCSINMAECYDFATPPPIAEISRQNLNYMENYWDIKELLVGTAGFEPATP